MKKAQSTNLEKYGYITNLQTDENKAMVKKTNLEKYGCENPMQSDIVKENLKSSMIAKYGVSHFSQSEEYKSRIYTCPYCPFTTHNNGMIKRWHGEKCKHKK